MYACIPVLCMALLADKANGHKCETYGVTEHWPYICQNQARFPSACKPYSPCSALLIPAKICCCLLQPVSAKGLVYMEQGSARHILHDQRASTLLHLSCHLRALLANQQGSCVTLLPLGCSLTLQAVWTIVKHVQLKGRNMPCSMLLWCCLAGAEYLCGLSYLANLHTFVMVSSLARVNLPALVLSSIATVKCHAGTGMN